jgi:hypothetical protein
MGLFSVPPPIATQGPVNSTPPIPHSPIGTQGDQPPRRQVAAVLAMVSVLASWPADLEPRLARPNDQQQKIAPLTVTYGTAPLPAPFLMPVELRQIVESWTPEAPRAQGPIRSTAWATILPAPAPYTTQPVAVRAAWDAPPLAPPTPTKIAPLTLQIGAQPIPQASVSVTELAQLVASWAVSWDAQSAPKSASWNVPPILVSLPYVPLPRLIWTAWEPPWIAPPAPVSIVTLTLPTGNQPLPNRSDRQVAIAATWAVDNPPQPTPKSAAWNTIATRVAYAPLPLAIRAAWEPAWQQPQPTVAIAPLTLTYGAAPTPKAPLSLTVLVRTVVGWILNWDAQAAAKNPPAAFIPSTVSPRRIAAIGTADNVVSATGAQTATLSVNGVPENQTNAIGTEAD